MSDLHNALLRGPWSQAVQNALGVTQSGEGGVERYGETLEPVIDLWRLPEWRYLRRERTGQQSATENAGAGRSRLGVQNNSQGDLVVVESMQNRGASGAIVLTLGFGLTVDSSESFRPTDTRFYTSAGALAATLSHRQGAIGGTTTTLGSMYMLQGVNYPLDIVVGPGWHLSTDPGADATLIGVAFRIRERVAQRGEL